MFLEANTNIQGLLSSLASESFTILKDQVFMWVECGREGEIDPPTQGQGLSV